jgi:hypothetical protein
VVLRLYRDLPEGCVKASEGMSGYAPVSLFGGLVDLTRGYTVPW